MRKFNMKAIALGVAVAMAAITGVSVEPAAAFGWGQHGWGQHGWGGHGWGGHGWGHHGWGWRGGYYGGGYDGGCYRKQYVDEDGEVVVRRVCE